MMSCHKPSAAVALVASIALWGSLAAGAGAATVIGALRAPGVVWISDGSKPATVSAEMRNTNKTFVPELLVVPAGSTVRFPNDDPFFHSIYAAGGADAFDLGFYGDGPGKDEILSAPGVLDVGCHIHQQMHAVIVVVDGPAMQTDDRSFILANVRPGNHQLHAWSAALGERTITVTVPSGHGILNLDRAF
ncbi:MAG: hypothetical protein ACREM8_12965 [Vulcanimicrobiaceae bacterium]